MTLFKLKDHTPSAEPLKFAISEFANESERAFNNQSPELLKEGWKTAGDTLANIKRMTFYQQALQLVQKEQFFTGDVLECGAGMGWLASEISKLERLHRVYALDFSETHLVRFGVEIQEVLGANSHKIQMCVGDFCKLEFADEQFDEVVFFHAIHHAGDVAGVLREAVRVLKPGGHVLLVEAILPLWNQALKKIHGAWQRQQGWSDEVYTLDDYRSFFSQAGLSLDSFPLWVEPGPRQWIKRFSPARLLITKFFSPPHALVGYLK